MLDAFRSRLAGWVTPKGRTAAKLVEQTDPEILKVLGALAVSTLPPARNTQQVLEAYGDMPWIHAVVRRISESFAAIEFTAMRTVGKGLAGKSAKSTHNKRLQYASLATRRRLVKQLKRSGELEELDNHPFIDFIERGNPMLSGMECRQVMQATLDLKGECFAWKERNGFGMPVAYWPLAPHWVRDAPGPGEDWFEIIVLGQRKMVPRKDLIWIKDPQPANPYGRGKGTADAFADELDSDEYAAKFIKSFFFNGAIPDLGIFFDGAGPDEIKVIKNDWDERYRGPQKAHRTHFFSRKADVQKLGQSFKDNDVVELRKFLRDAVLQGYGLPPEIMGIIEHSNRATIDAAELLFSRWILVPRAERWRNALQIQVAADFDPRLVIGYESPVPDDKAFSLEVAKAAPQMVTRGEWRELGGREVDQNGGDDVFLMAQGLIEVRRGEPLPPPPVPVAPVPPTGQPAVPPEPSKAMVRESMRGAIVRGVERHDVETILDSMRAQTLTEETDSLWDEELQQWGERVLNDLGISTSFSMLNPRVTEHLRDFSGLRISGINKTTREQLRAELIEGVEAGEGVRELASRIEDVFDEADGARATTIARTEVLRSSNFAEWEGQRQSGVIRQRQWLATPDERVRDEHAQLNGQVVEIDEPFVIDGYSAMYPGDFGEPEMDINCRCTTIAVIENRAFDAAVMKGLWDRYDASARAWESKAERAFRRGFAMQRRDVLRALRAA